MIISQRLNHRHVNSLRRDFKIWVDQVGNRIWVRKDYLCSAFIDRSALFGRKSHSADTTIALSRAEWIHYAKLGLPTMSIQYLSFCTMTSWTKVWRNRSSRYIFIPFGKKNEMMLYHSWNKRFALIVEFISYGLKNIIYYTNKIICLYINYYSNFI